MERTVGVTAFGKTSGPLPLVSLSGLLSLVEHSRQVTKIVSDWELKQISNCDIIIHSQA